MTMAARPSCRCRKVGAARNGMQRPRRPAVVIASGGRAGSAAVTGVYDSRSSAICSWHVMSLNSRELGFAHQIRRKMLRNVVIGRARHAEFVRSVIHDRLHAAKIIEGRRRRNRPFQRRRMPGILFLAFLPGLQAPEEIEQEDELRADRDERGDADEHVDRLQVSAGSRPPWYRNSAADARPGPGSAWA